MPDAFQHLGQGGLGDPDFRVAELCCFWDWPNECLWKQFVARLLGLGIALIVILAAAPAIRSIQPLRDKILEDRFPYFLANEL